MNVHNKLDMLAFKVCSLHSPAVIEVDAWVFHKPHIENIFKKPGCLVARIEPPPKDKKHLLKVLDDLCKFPDYFGFNWDALADCLIDFHWIEPVKGYIFIFENPQELAPEDLKVFLDIVQKASGTWARDGIPFKLLVPTGSLNL